MGFLKVFWRTLVVDSLGINIIPLKISLIQHLLLEEFMIIDHNNIPAVLEMHMIYDHQDYFPIMMQIIIQCFKEIYQLRLWFFKETIKPKSIDSFMKWKTILKVNYTFQGVCKIYLYQHNRTVQLHAIQITFQMIQLLKKIITDR